LFIYPRTALQFLGPDTPQRLVADKMLILCLVSSTPVSGLCRLHQALLPFGGAACEQTMSGRLRKQTKPAHIAAMDLHHASAVAILRGCQKTHNLPDTPEKQD
jgi:hypothetical protein